MALKSKNTPLNITKEPKRDKLQGLRDDHQQIQEIIFLLTILDRKAKKRFVETALSELYIHIKVEEEVIYPLLRKEEHSRGIIPNTGNVEDYFILVLISQLVNTDISDQYYESTINLLVELLQNHVLEAENIFRRLEDMNIDLDQLADRFIKRQQILNADLMRNRLEKIHTDSVLVS
jgi:hypothetical protein